MIMKPAVVRLVTTLFCLTCLHTLASAQDERLERAVRDIRSSWGSGDFVRIDGEESVRGVLEAARFGPPSGWVAEKAPSGVAHRDSPPEARLALTSHVATFLSLLAEGDAEAYVAWVKERGCTLIEDEDRNRERNTHLMLLQPGAQVPFFDSEASFEALFEARATAQNGRGRPVEISADDAGCRIRCLVAGPGVKAKALYEAAFQTEEELRRWVGYVVILTDRDWEPPVSREEIAARDGETLVAWVTVGLRGATGELIPARILTYYDPESAVWHIEQIGLVNAPDLDASWDY